MTCKADRDVRLLICSDGVSYVLSYCTNMTVLGSKQHATHYATDGRVHVLRCLEGALASLRPCAAQHPGFAGSSTLRMLPRPRRAPARPSSAAPASPPVRRDPTCPPPSQTA